MKVKLIVKVKLIMKVIVMKVIKKTSAHYHDCVLLYLFLYDDKIVGLKKCCSNCQSSASVN